MRTQLQEFIKSEKIDLGMSISDVLCGMSCVYFETLFLELLGNGLNNINIYVSFPNVVSPIHRIIDNFL